MKIVRYPIMLIVLALGLFVLVREAHHLNNNDFTVYWSVSRINLAGGTISDELARVLEQGGWSRQDPTMMYTPPWALPFITLFGFFDRPVGQLIWMLFHIAALLFCANYTWQLYGGPLKHRWVALLLVFTFGPVVSAVLFQGQISPLILTGLVGFLVFIDKPGKAWLAGMFAVLATMKPQVPYLFFIALLLWTILNKKWSVIIGFLAFFGGLNIIELMINPHILSQYIQFWQNDAPTAWATPTIGTYIRLLFYPQGFFLVFIPPLLGAIWLVIYWIKHQSPWNWKYEMPLFLCVSVITAPYIWTYDQVVLLIPLLQAFVWLLVDKKRWMAGFIAFIYIFIDLSYLRLHLIMDDFKFIWFAPVILLWYLIAQYFHQRAENIPVVNEFG
jgi:hypothetical protein